MYTRHYGILTGLAALLFTSPALALRLEVPADSHLFFHFSAYVLLYAHIGGGALGIVSGTVASLTRKGSQVHRSAGKLFLWSMFLCYLIGALVAPFLTSQQSTNFVAALLALYLLLSGVSAASRRQFVADIREQTGAAVAAFVTLLGIIFMVLSYRDPSGTFDGSPPQAYILFIVAGSLALVGELNALYQHTLPQTSRIFRHLWRMCMSFFIAAGSAFFGQSAFFPEWFNATYLPLALGFFPLIILIIYTGKFLVGLIVRKRTGAVAHSSSIGS